MTESYRTSVLGRTILVDGSLAQDIYQVSLREWAYGYKRSRSKSPTAAYQRDELLVSPHNDTTCFISSPQVGWVLFGRHDRLIHAVGWVGLTQDRVHAPPGTATSSCDDKSSECDASYSSTGMYLYYIFILRDNIVSPDNAIIVSFLSAECWSWGR